MAAPIRTDDATAKAVAPVLELDRARKGRVPTKPDLTPYDVLAWYDYQQRRIDSVFARDFGPAVYRTLLADISTWPAAFQRRIGEPLREARDGGESWHFRPDWIWRRFEEGRRMGADEHEIDPNGCGCGCRGFNDSFLRHLRMLRTESAETREIRAKAVHSPRSKAALRQRRERIAHWKGELVELLWLHGQRRIDRTRLREHAAEHHRAELAETRRWIAESPRKVREACERLRENRTYNRQGPTDRPMSPGLRLETERFIEERKRRVPKWRARVAELEALLANPHAGARQWTGCERTHAEARA